MTSALDNRDFHIGLVGLGVMGRNLAFNMADKGISVSTFDPWPQARDDFSAALDSFAHRDRIELHDTLPGLIAKLPTPRSILLMVKAGDPVDDLITGLMLLLNPGDTLIDGGNSFYRDTMRRESRLREKGVFFIGLGISGGEEGARKGPALMAGGEAAAYARIEPLFKAVAARFDDTPCCARLGGNGAGHFVKMIHNGIEYGIMQLIAEAYMLLRDMCSLGHREMTSVFRQWDRTELASYLIGITADILDKKDDLSGKPLVEMILDQAQQKGTGRWSSEAALEFGAPAPTITEAVFSRSLSALKEDRLAVAAAFPAQSHPTPTPRAAMDTQVEAVRMALLGAVISTYAQGIAVIKAAARDLDWDIDLKAVAATWRAGCIIRADLLNRIMNAYSDQRPPCNLIAAPEFARLLTDTEAGWRKTLCLAIEARIPVPGLTSALAYVDGYRQGSSCANMIQAQRDYFGAHTYQRIDRPGTFHSDWSDLSSVEPA